MKRSISIRVLGLAAALSAGSAIAAPLALGPGASGSTPRYDNRTPTTSTPIGFKCGFFGGTPCTTSLSMLQSTAESILLSSGGFIEAAGTTALNPYGPKDVALAFILGGAEATSIASVTLSALAGYSTSVEACAPIFASSFMGCAPGSAGTAARSSGTGDSIMFQSLGHSMILGSPVTDGYVVYTNAPTSALTDPANFVVNLGGNGNHTLPFTGFGLTPPSGSGGGTSVPEPASLGLLALGLLGAQLAQRARRRR